MNELNPEGFLKNKKGQMVFLDMFLVSSIFIVLFIFVSSNYSQKLSDIIIDSRLEKMKMEAINASDYLILSQGYPANWEKDLNASVIGLALKPHELDSNKVSRFIAMDYAKAKDALGVSEFDYHFRIANSDYTDIVSSGVAPVGRTPVASIERIVVYNGEPKKLILRVWG
ncbi:hypothetical protein HZB89_00165 [archaeon]|nr:hypothetical protein [archaeon]